MYVGVSEVGRCVSRILRSGCSGGTQELGLEKLLAVFEVSGGTWNLFTGELR